MASRRRAKSRGETMREARTLIAAMKSSQKADDAAVLEDGMAAVVRLGGEAVAQVAAGAGEDGGGEERGFSALEGGGGNGAGALLKLSPWRRTAQPPFGSGSRCHGPAVSASEAVSGSSRSARMLRNSSVKARIGRAGGVDDESVGRRGKRRDGRVLFCRVVLMELLLLECLGPGELPTHSGPLLGKRAGTIPAGTSLKRTSEESIGGRAA